MNDRCAKLLKLVPKELRDRFQMVVLELPADPGLEFRAALLDGRAGWRCVMSYDIFGLKKKTQRMMMTLKAEEMAKALDEWVAKNG